MPSSVITNGKVFQFKDLVLHGTLTSWDHRIGVRLAVHESLKRDGGEVEPMGAAPGRLSYRCALIGPDVTQRYRELVASVRRDPRGVLIDPRLGSLRAACEGIEAAENPEEGIDSIEFSIHFVEDQLDAVLEAPPGPQQLAARVGESVAGLNDVIPSQFSGNIFTSVLAVRATLPKLADAASAFTAAALASASTSTPDPALAQMLGVVLAQQVAFKAALEATLPDTLAPPVTLVPYALLADQVYIGCLALYQRVASAVPASVPYTVPTAMPLTQVALALYGRDELARLADIRAMNRIKTPYWIPQGTVLNVPAPVVRQ